MISDPQRFRVLGFSFVSSRDSPLMLSSAFRFRELPLRLSPDFRPPEISCPRFLVLIITFRRSHCSVIVEKPFSGDLPDEPFLRRYTAASAAPGT